MPELPETHTIATVLDKYLSGKRISKVSVAKSYKALPSTELFIKASVGKKILSVTRVAKNILLNLDNKNTILFHLAMTGRLLITESNREKFVKVIIDFEKDQDSSATPYPASLVFSDMRMFGKAAVIGPKQKEQLINRYGPDPLDQMLTAQDLYKALQSKRTTVKNALLNQEIIAGLGNIYATDALYLSKINPSRKTSDLQIEDAEILIKSIREVLLESINLGGSTLSDKMYVDPFGNEGRYQTRFKVYSLEKCALCGSPTKIVKISGRNTYYCPSCQSY